MKLLWSVHLGTSTAQFAIPQPMETPSSVREKRTHAPRAGFAREKEGEELANLDLFKEFVAGFVCVGGSKVFVATLWCLCRHRVVRPGSKRWRSGPIMKIPGPVCESFGIALAIATLLRKTAICTCCCHLRVSAFLACALGRTQSKASFGCLDPFLVDVWSLWDFFGLLCCFCFLGLEIAHGKWDQDILPVL